MPGGDAGFRPHHLFRLTSASPIQAASASPGLLAASTLPEPLSTGPSHTTVSPVEAGLRFITDRLDVPAALLFAADAAGALQVVAAYGKWGDDEVVLSRLAESLGGTGVDVIDVTDALEGARFAAGARLGAGEGALMVLAPDEREPDDAWTEAFAASTRLALGLVRSVPNPLDPGRILHEVAIHPGTFEERLDIALQRAAETLGLDGAAFARVEGNEWTPHTVYDPSGGLVPIRPVPLSETFCMVTAQSDGPFAVEDAAESPLPINEQAAYLGAPVLMGGRCVGTFSVVGAVPRPRPFTDGDRALVESLARWVGSWLHSDTTARRLADREADLAAFFDGAPMGLGVARVLDDDLAFVRFNGAAATALGTTPEDLAGRRASELSQGGSAGRALARQWVEAARAAIADGAAHRFEAAVETADGTRMLAATVSPIEGAGDDARCAFVVEDITDRREAAERAIEREAQIEAVLSHAPVALFAGDADGRLVMSRGRSLELLGLGGEAAVGRSLTDLFASAPGAAAGIAAALRGAAATWRAEADDRTFEVRVHARPDPDGRPAGLIGVAHDVTEREAGARAAAHAAQARRELLKHLDREIRSPLTSILGYADLLDDTATADDVRHVRGVIERAGEQLMDALDELALLGADTIAARPVSTDMASVVAAAAEASRTAADARRISLNLWCTLPGDPVLIDAALFERLVRHLVSGAVAAAEVPRVDVKLSAAGPDTIELTVTGGIQTDALGLREGYVPRLAEALGGTAHRIEGSPPGWTLRLPRQPVPVLELSEAAWIDEAPGEAPAMAWAGASA